MKILKSGRERQKGKSEGDITTEEWSERCKVAGFRIEKEVTSQEM